MADTPLRSGYLEAGAAYTRVLGPQAWVETGARLRPNLGLYGRAYVTPEDVGVGVGVRWEFDF